MQPITFAASDSYDIAILIKHSSFNDNAIDSNYAAPLAVEGIERDRLISYALPYNSSGKAPVKHIKVCLDELIVHLQDMGVKYIYCADAAFFKVLSGLKKAEAHLGYCLPCKYTNYEGIKVVLGINHTSLIYNPLNENKLNLSIKALINAVNDTPPEFEQSILKHYHYPQSIDQIEQALNDLHQYPVLSVDIETFSLDHDKAGIGTIAFAWNDSSGIAFAVDYVAIPEQNGVHGEYKINLTRRELLKQFFLTYQGETMYHRANFDIKVLIYVLFMDELDDTAGLLDGLQCLTRDFDDTRIIAYLALNSCAGNELSLKALAHEYAGNYAQDEIKDITRIPLPDLLEYNLVDSCCTQWVHTKYFEQMVSDQQEDIYWDVMIPSLKTIIQMELTGMPLMPDRVQEVKHKLQIIRGVQHNIIRKHPAIIQVQDLLKHREYVKDYESRVAKAKHPENIKKKDFAVFPDITFNSNSPLQLQVLLYEVLQLKVIEKTKTGQPATGADVIEKLQAHVIDESVKTLFDALIAFAGAEKILTTFIAAFERAIAHSPDDPRVYLHGSFNLGGTVSGRLSSSDPNLQNLPSNSQYGKLIKSCFVANDNDLFVGADFASLEAMINALTTKDPNKLAVYENNYDSHSWNAYGYWGHKMPDIQFKMNLADQGGKFYKQEQPDGSFVYFHESELPT